MRVSEESAATFQATIKRGGIAIFPTDTLYGIACDPDDAAAARRIHELKGRPPLKPSAVMFFTLRRMFEEIGADLDDATRAIVQELLPGPFTFVVANPSRRFAVACADRPERLGVRVPRLAEPIAALEAVTTPVMQTSANRSGGPDAAGLDQIEPAIVAGVDLVLDGGELAGSGSTVVDLSELPHGRWRLLRRRDAAAEQLVTQAVGFAPLEV
jgi:L-threonylcarbamoyladenylate synthase